MSRRLAIAAVLAGSLLLPAAAGAYQYRIVGSLANQAQIQRAISYQANRQLARHWQIDPVSFTDTGGIPIILVDDATAACRTPAWGCHGSFPGLGAIIYVAGNLGPDHLSTAISHEILETEVDQCICRTIDGRLVEISDDVAGGGYRLFGVAVDDFDFPRWWYGAPKGTYDMNWMLDRPRQPGRGGVASALSRSDCVSQRGGRMCMLSPSERS